MRLAMLLPMAAVLMVAACGSDRTPVPSSPGDAKAAAATQSGPHSATQSGSLGIAPGTAPLRGITNAVTAPAIDASGAAQHPTTTFHAATDRSVVAVLHLADLPAGTKLSYVRYLDNRFVDSRTSSLAKTSRSFFFTFTAQPGKNLAIGRYRLRLYVNEQAAGEALYQVT